MRGRSWGPSFTAKLGLVLLLAPAFAGCSGGNFHVDKDLWTAGYAWEYIEVVREDVRVDGDAPAGLDDEEEGELVENHTLRVEIFNSTAGSVEGIPIYAAAVLTTTIPDNESEQEGEQASQDWEVWVYTEDLNLVEPTYVDWRNQEVQLSGEEGGVSEDDEAASNETNNQPENEERLLDWPLTKGKRWRHAERVSELETDGVFDGRVLGKGSVRVPAGHFDVVRISGKLQPLDTEELEDGIADSLESQGAQVERLSFDYTVNFEYTYSDKVLNFVTYRETERTVLRASGTDSDGAEFDFTFTRTIVEDRKLDSYQKETGAEKPLTFAADVERGLYAPKPITPASHLAVEILATTQAINKALPDEKVSFGVRIYNSSAGETKMRGLEASYPHVVPGGQFNPQYDHTYLEIVWQLDSVDRRNTLHEFRTEAADQLTLKSSDFPSYGWKQVRATLRLKNAENTTDPNIFTDYVAFEVYFHTNQTAGRPIQNVSQPDIRTSFAVEPSATRITIRAKVTDPATPPESQCPVSGSTDCVQVSDAGNRGVPDQRSTKMEFETTSTGSTSYGTWTVRYSPSAPGQTVQFEIIVRYRIGA